MKKLRALRSRILLGVGLGVILLVAGVLCSRSIFPESAPEVVRRSEIIAALYEKEIAIEGLSALTQEEVEAHLPLARSVVWWHLFPGEVEKAVLQHPLVKAVSFETSIFSPTQFVIRVHERQPRFVVPVQDEVWLVADDGVFLREVTTNVPERSEIRVPQRLILVSGATSRSSSPDLLRSRLRYLAQVAEVIESEAGRKIEEISLSGSDELQVQFSETDFQTVFSQVDDDFSGLAKEAKRFAMLRDRLAAQGSRVEMVDLSYPANAVVRMVQESPALTKGDKKSPALAKKEDHSVVRASIRH